MNNRFRWTFATLAFAALAAFPVIAGQGAGLQRPRITTNSVIKPTATPGKFKTATLPVTFTPAKPISPFGAIFGQAQFDLTEDSIRVVGNDMGNHVGVKVLLASANRPVTFDFEIYAKSQKKLGVAYKVGVAVAELNGANGSRNLNVSTLELQDLKQTVSITATPTKEGWVMASIAPNTLGSAFEVMSVTVRRP